MEWRDKPSVLRRGAAPPDARTSARIVLIAAAIHVLLLPAFAIRLRAPAEITLPGGAPARMRLVRLTPLRTVMPPAETPAAPAKAKPKPALLKKFTQNAKIAMREERAPTKKGKADESKPAPKEKEITASPADLLPRWLSA